MQIDGATVIITGGGSGIGAALAAAFSDRGARVLIADIDGDAATGVAGRIGGEAIRCDVTREADIQAAVARAEALFGPPDIIVSNAGIGRGQPGHAASASDEIWQLNWQVHVMAHVYAARAVLPGMIARRRGHLVQMASAAGLLCQIGDAAYSATKHAAVSFAESLAITHGHEGIGVSLVCPQYVATPLIGLQVQDVRDDNSLLSAEAAAKIVADGVERDAFLILTHPDVAKFVALKTADYDRWLEGMRRLQAKAMARFGRVDPGDLYRLV